MAHIVEVRLSTKAADVLTANAHRRASDWLTHWTPEQNFKGVVAESLEAALGVLQHDFVMPCFMLSIGLKPEHLEFQLSRQELDADGRYWPDSRVVYLTWYPFKEPR